MQNILPDFPADFEYVIQKQEKQKICFGSGCPRDTSKKGMSPFMKQFTLEDNPDVGPNTYNTLASFKAIKTKPCSHSISNKGFSGIARFGKKIERDENYPAPTDYNISVLFKRDKQSKIALPSKTTKRKTLSIHQTPGPGMYAKAKQEEIKFEHTFGGRVKMKLGVDLKCCSYNADVCEICDQKPIGDYWHLDGTIFLCRTCMNKERNEHKIYRRTDLERFRKIRDCSVIHRHEGTNAKIWLMHPTAVSHWIRRETYLSVYLRE